MHQRLSKPTREGWIVVTGIKEEAKREKPMTSKDHVREPVQNIAKILIASKDDKGPAIVEEEVLFDFLLTGLVFLPKLKYKVKFKISLTKTVMHPITGVIGIRTKINLIEEVYSSSRRSCCIKRLEFIQLRVTKKT